MASPVNFSVKQLMGQIYDPRLPGFRHFPSCVKYNRLQNQQRRGYINIEKCPLFQTGHAQHTDQN